MAKAVEKASALGAWPQAAFAQIKRNRVEEIAQRVSAHREEKERLFVERWYSDEARRQLTEAIARF